MEPTQPVEDQPAPKGPKLVRAKWTLRRLLMALVILGTVGVGAFSVGRWGMAWLFRSVWIDHGEETRIGKYEKVLKQWGSSELVAHFPRKLPTDAHDAQFRAWPAFLQGGAVIQLRYTTTPEEIARLHAKFSAIKTASFFGGDSIAHRKQPGGMPTTEFYTSGSEDREFPDDYEVMLFGDRSSPSSGSSWNHGRTCGVAISTQRNTIVYWAEAW